VIGKRPLWLSLTGAAAVLAVVVFAVAWFSEPDLVPIPAPAGDSVTIAGDITLEQAGAQLSAQVTISADRDLTLRGLVVRLRDDTGTPHDFPVLNDVDVGTAPREIRVSQDVVPPGGYTCYLAYRLDGDWVSLPPWRRTIVK